MPHRRRLQVALRPCPAMRQLHCSGPAAPLQTLRRTSHRCECALRRQMRPDGPSLLEQSMSHRMRLQRVMRDGRAMLLIRSPQQSARRQRYEMRSHQQPFMAPPPALQPLRPAYPRTVHRTRIASTSVTGVVLQSPLPSMSALQLAGAALLVCPTRNEGPRPVGMSAAVHRHPRRARAPIVSAPGAAHGTPVIPPLACSSSAAPTISSLVLYIPTGDPQQCRSYLPSDGQVSSTSSRIVHPSEQPCSTTTALRGPSLRIGAARSCGSTVWKMSNRRYNGHACAPP